jgi:DNA-binding NarL/FixJ family response regulator
MERAPGPPKQTPSATRLFIISEVRLYREGLALALSAHPSLEVVEARDPDDETVGTIAHARPAVVLVDAAVVQRAGFVSNLVAAAPDVKVVAFGVDDDEDNVIACAEAGAAGYVARDASLPDLIRMLEGLERGELHYPPRVAALLFRRIGSLAADRLEPQARAGARPLTSREQEVLALLDQGLSNKEIARCLDIRLPTVKNHVHHILEKLQVERRGQAIARTWRPGSARRSVRSL